MRNEGIGSWPARRRRKSPNRVAIVHEGRELTYRELDRRVLRLASALRAVGVARGDRIAYLGPNHPAFLETLFAAGVLGAVFVPLNLRLATGELAYVLGHSGASVLVHGPEQAEVEAVLYDHPGVAECAVIAFPDAKWGEVGRAVVVAASDAPTDEQDILEFLDSRLARYKIPKSVVFVDEIPRTASGKVLKRPLRERYGAP